MTTVDVYTSISQRASASFRKTLVKTPPQGAAQNDLHAFFRGFYDALFFHPEAFGLPLGPDLAVAPDEANEKERKQEVMQKIKKPRTMILQGLDFLRLAGLEGRLDGAELLHEDFPALCKTSGIARKFLGGLQGCGLEIHVAGPCASLSSKQFPEMFAGLRALARACDSEHLGSFHFARCDFRAGEPGYEADLQELFEVFEPREMALASQLNELFSAKGYKTSLESHGPHQWVLKYQGSRKAKATPFFQIEYEERYSDPLRLTLKCASTNRIAPLLAGQPANLQADFARRVFRCNGDKCNWCRNQKSLGPSTLTIDGEERTVCWFSNGNIRERDEGVVELVRQYADLHDQLAPER